MLWQVVGQFKTFPAKKEGCKLHSTLFKVIFLCIFVSIDKTLPSTFNSLCNFLIFLKNIKTNNNNYTYGRFPLYGFSDFPCTRHTCEHKCALHLAIQQFMSSSLAYRKLIRRCLLFMCFYYY